MDSFLFTQILQAIVWRGHSLDFFNHHKERRAMKKKGLILTVLACAGVVSTAVLAVKATPKAMLLLEEKPEDIGMVEKAITVAPAYVPVMISGVATIGCILGIGVLSRRQQAALVSAYAMVSSNYKRYQNKLKELYGEEAHQNVIDAIVKTDVSDDHFVYSRGLIGNESLDGFIDEKHLFYDEFSNRYFESTMSKVLQAEYHFNRNYVLRGGSCVNEFYEFLGIDPIDGGDELGWSYCELEIAWLDFNHRIIEIAEDGLECCVIEMVFTPQVMEESYEI